MSAGISMHLVINVDNTESDMVRVQQPSPSSIKEMLVAINTINHINTMYCALSTQVYDVPRQVLVN